MQLELENGSNTSNISVSASPALMAPVILQRRQTNVLILMQSYLLAARIRLIELPTHWINKQHWFDFHALWLQHCPTNPGYLRGFKVQQSQLFLHT